MIPVANSVATVSQASQTYIERRKPWSQTRRKAILCAPSYSLSQTQKGASHSCRKLKIDPRKPWSHTRRIPSQSVVSYSPYPIEFTTLCCAPRLNSFGRTKHILRRQRDAMRPSLRYKVNEVTAEVAIASVVNRASRLRSHASVGRLRNFFGVHVPTFQHRLTRFAAGGVALPFRSSASPHCSGVTASRKIKESEPCR